MAKQGLFIERLDGKAVNLNMSQTVVINPLDATNVLWYYKNGEVFEEDLVTEEEAQNRLKDLKGLLLGTTVAELEQRITEQQQTIAEQAQELEDINLDITELTQTSDSIIGEVTE